VFEIPYVNPAPGAMRRRHSFSSGTLAIHYEIMEDSLDVAVLL
jgi:hypothetical protein